MTLTFDLLILKVATESHVTWATSVSISVSLGLSVLDLRPDVCDRQTSDMMSDSIFVYAPADQERGHNEVMSVDQIQSVNLFFTYSYSYS